MADKVVPRQVARLGRTVRLQCPVEGDPPPLTMWTKDGRTIHSGWSRFRVLPQGLKVKEVEAEDAGVYVCKATNGFGSLSVNYTLIIMGQLAWGSEITVGPKLAGHKVYSRHTWIVLPCLFGLYQINLDKIRRVPLYLFPAWILGQPRPPCHWASRGPLLPGGRNGLRGDG